MFDILCQYGITYTSLVAEQMLGMIKDYFAETRSLSKNGGVEGNLLFPGTVVKENVPG